MTVNITLSSNISYKSETMQGIRILKTTIRRKGFSLNIWKVFLWVGVILYALAWVFFWIFSYFSQEKYYLELLNARDFLCMKIMKFNTE